LKIYFLETGRHFGDESFMAKKKSDTEKKPKDSKPPKAEKKASGKPASPQKAKIAPAKKMTEPMVTPDAATPPPAHVSIEKPKLSLPKKPSPIKRPAVVLTTEDIALRAYFIAERRNRMGWPGDETSDWVEAERQLQAEAAKKQR